ncbi:MAG: methylmalonyl-CoA mutase family protein, partial [Caldimonas sp.]
KILAIMKTVDEAGGMYKAVESGLVQRMIGASAMRFQRRVEAGEQVIVGVNKYQAADEAANRPAVERPDPAAMKRHLDAFQKTKAARSSAAVTKALDAVTRAAGSDGNVFGAVVDGARAGLTNEEICGRLRRDLGFGQPLVIV